MSWLFSRALVEASWPATSSDGEQSVQLSGNPIPQAYCAPDKMTDFSRLSRFGMTFKPLTADRGEELLMSYRAVFHAKTSQQQEKAQELTEREAECGERWQGWLAKFDPSTSSWRTPQCSLLEDLNECLQTLPRSGMTRDGLLWEQQMLVPHTSETEFGSWPTPTASQMPCEGTVRIMRKQWLEGNVSLEEASAIAGRDVRKSQGKVPMWPTPCATDHKGSGKTGELRDRLDYAVERGSTKSKDYTWPTPQASDWKNKSYSRDFTLGNPKYIWPTPRTKGMSGGSGSWDLLKKNTTTEEARQMGAGNGGKLNPTWVEWLMGWPLGWTDLKPLEMDKYQKWLDEHGSC